MSNTTAQSTIVPARREHVPFIAWVLRTAARSHLPLGLWDLLIDPNDEERVLRFLEALTDTPEAHWAHHSLFLVSEVDGVPAAALCGYLDEEHGTRTLAAALPIATRAAGISDAEFAAGMARASSMTNIEPSHEAGAWIVEHVATAPEFRRQGHVERLMSAVLDRGRARGSTAADIGVLIGNDRAQRAYEKCGFRVTGDITDAAFEAAYGSPGARIMTRAI